MNNHILTVVAGVWEARDFTLYHLVNNCRLYFVSSLPLGLGPGKASRAGVGGKISRSYTPSTGSPPSNFIRGLP